MTIMDYPFLDDTACDDLAHLLNEHSDLGIDRNPALPGTFITYGRAAYLDLCLPKAVPERDYFGALRNSNQVLLESFGGFYETLRTKLKQILNEPVMYRPDLFALPGVHIFRGQGIRSAGEAGFHFDVQYQRLRLPTPIDAGASPISITILLQSPKGGTGLRVYDVTYADYERAYRMGRIHKLDDLVARKTSWYYAYTRGRLVLHRGLVVHSLTSPGPVEHDDERITVQGHGIRCDGKWILYW
jgi:hypothetical protein